MIGFEAEDDFQSAAGDPWRPEAGAARAEDDDPFLTPQDPLQPFAVPDQGPVRAAPGANPVAEMIAG
ncbi:MAG TPA: hypothetical protein VJP88_05935, partial [Caulobacteraceae bacterium]|nr:hypothetical protein [Caulobacteraceae bacterium]